MMKEIALIVGGSSGMGKSAAQIPAGTIRLETPVHTIREIGSSLQVAADAAGERVLLTAEHVIITLPPRLVASTLQFDPPLPPTVLAALRSTQTWIWDRQ